MPRSLLALAFVLGLTAPALAELKIQNIKARHGHFGPERASLDVYPGDEIDFTYSITGVQSDADGQVDCEIELKATDEAGKTLFNRKTPIKEVLAFGGTSMPGFANLGLGLTTKPGKYSLALTVTDKLSQETASFERTVTCLKPDFTIVRPRFSYDAEGKAGAALTAVVAQKIFFSMTAAHFDRTAKKIEMTWTMQLYDAKGKELMPKPLTVKVASDDEEAVAKNETVTFSGSFTCGQPGAFKVKITATDKVNNKTATFEAPIKVLE